MYTVAVYVQLFHPPYHAPLSLALSHPYPRSPSISLSSRALIALTLSLSLIDKNLSSYDTSFVVLFYSSYT